VQTLSIPALAREVALLLLAVMLMVCGLTVELRPLLRVRDEVAGRDPMDLDPVKAGDLPQELRPIVEVINQCIQRLNEYVLRQKRFIADAAHQIRTPLAILGCSCGTPHSYGTTASCVRLSALRRAAPRP
jgi:two-component system sensor histidine kinase TctE